jgi:leucyl-tRNA synthetase
VDPEDLIDRYGADTVRLFCLFAAPPERDLDWTSEGVEGAYRFIGRVWNLVYQHKDRETKQEGIKDSDRARFIRRLTNKTIKKVTEDIKGRFHFNTAVAAVMEFTNELGRITPEEADEDPSVAAALREAIRAVVVLLSPFVPHVAEELWEALGEAPGMTRVPWPSYDPALLEQEELLIIVQVNGKKRGEITVPVEASEDEIKAAAQANPNVQKFLEGKTIRKMILVPGRLLNVVVS